MTSTITTQPTPDLNSGPIAVSASRTIAASPEVIYDLITDLRRTGEWSPEATKAEWIKGATGPEVGAVFKGWNEAGPNKWTTKPTVTEAERGRVFAFKVPGKSGPQWRYELHANPDGTTEVTESMAQSHRSPLYIRLLIKRAGITNRAANLQHNLTTTLENLAAAAEA